MNGLSIAWTYRQAYQNSYESDQFFHFSVQIHHLPRPLQQQFQVQCQNIDHWKGLKMAQVGLQAPVVDWMTTVEVLVPI